MTSEKPWYEWVGRSGEPAVAPYPVSAAAIGYLAEATEDEQLAAYVADGGQVAPRSFVTIASRIPNWRPRTATGPSTFMLALSVPVPADSAVNTVVDQTYHAPLRVGDRLTSQSTILAVEPRRTRLGDGYLITERIEHRNQDDLLVATTDNSMYRFQKEPAPRTGPAPVEPRRPTDIPGTMAAGHTKEDHFRTPFDPLGGPPRSDFEPVVLPITPTRLTVAAGAVRDFSPIHHDVDFARGAGHRTAFLSFSTQLAIVVRALREWLHGDEAVRRLDLRMKVPMYLGSIAACTGTRSLRADGPADRDVITVTLSADDVPCTVGTAEIDKGAL